MYALLYYLLILPVSLLPFPLLYLLSDFLFIILFYLLPYRKRLVLENLRRSFPEKGEKELLQIRRRFYRHFCDMVVESLKTFTASPASIRARVELVNLELIDRLYKDGKSVILATGHYANWEWPAITLPYHSAHTATGIYKKLSNPFFDRKLQRSRSRFGLKLMSTREVAQFFSTHEKELCTYGFINDQSPSDPRRGHWMEFLHQDTCMLLGVETYAVKYDFPVVYVMITKKRRGHYRLEYRLVSEHPRKEPQFAITEACARINEAIIREEPAYWLWTHRRWKHRRPR
ncbi:MAG: hypothetical protein RL213_329 [Bacteroidota bacterium]|jgi:KDO2-lipid IV(A) lauroyltransferase